MRDLHLETHNHNEFGPCRFFLRLSRIVNVGVDYSGTCSRLLSQMSGDERMHKADYREHSIVMREFAAVYDRQLRQARLAIQGMV